MVTDYRGNFNGLDYDIRSKTFYWTDTAANKIYSQSSSSERSTVVDSGSLLLSDYIAHDWIHRNLYWSDNTNKVIKVRSLETGAEYVVIQEGLNSARGIAVDPWNG